MKHSSLIKLFKHIKGQQISHGVRDAFRFKWVLSSRRKGHLIEAQYPDLALTPSYLPNSLIEDNEIPRPSLPIVDHAQGMYSVFQVDLHQFQQDRLIQHQSLQDQ